MNAYFHSSGPRSNAYSRSKFTNWTKYQPFFAEADAAYKRFDQRLPEYPDFPRVVVLPPLEPYFMRVCNRQQVEHRLRKMPPEHLVGLRAVFLLSGTRKQQRSWESSLACAGIYCRCCVFLFAYPSDLAQHWYIDELRKFFLNDVLVHEVAHHVDRFRSADTRTKEGFANGFVERRCA